MAALCESIELDVGRSGGTPGESGSVEEGDVSEPSATGSGISAFVAWISSSSLMRVIG